MLKLFKKKKDPAPAAATAPAATARPGSPAPPQTTTATTTTAGSPAPPSATDHRRGSVPMKAVLVRPHNTPSEASSALSTISGASDSSIQGIVAGNRTRPSIDSTGGRVHHQPSLDDDEERLNTEATERWIRRPSVGLPVPAAAAGTPSTVAAAANAAPGGVPAVASPSAPASAPTATQRRMVSDAAGSAQSAGPSGEMQSRKSRVRELATMHQLSIAPSSASKPKKLKKAKAAKLAKAGKAGKAGKTPKTPKTPIQRTASTHSASTIVSDAGDRMVVRRPSLSSIYTHIDMDGAPASPAMSFAAVDSPRPGSIPESFVFPVAPASPVLRSPSLMSIEVAGFVRRGASHGASIHKQLSVRAVRARLSMYEELSMVGRDGGADAGEDEEAAHGEDEYEYSDGQDHD
ncbi:hypothetical protein BC831DRAFT_505964, partial [Entophlyctis helioformis]